MQLFRLTLSDSQKYEINSCRGWKWNSKNSTRRQRNRVVGVDEGGDKDLCTDDGETYQFDGLPLRGI